MAKVNYKVSSSKDRKARKGTIVQVVSKDNGVHVILKKPNGEVVRSTKASHGIKSGLASKKVDTLRAAYLRMYEQESHDTDRATSVLAKYAK